MQSASILPAASFFQSRPVDHPLGRGLLIFEGFPAGRGITDSGNAIKRGQKKETKMNTKVLLLGAVVAAFSFTSFATDAPFSARAQANQIKVVPRSVAAPASTIAYVDGTASAQLSPRAQANQIKVVKGTASDRNPALECVKNMVGSPKAVAECSSHTTMPGCMKVATIK